MIPERVKRVERELQRVLAEIVRELRDPRLEHVVITEVKVAKDLSAGQVYVSALTPVATTAALKALQKAAGKINFELGHTLDLRRIPRFTYLHDPSMAQGAHIDAILADVLPPPSDDDPERTPDASDHPDL